MFFITLFIALETSFTMYLISQHFYLEREREKLYTLSESKDVEIYLSL